MWLRSAIAKDSIFFDLVSVEDWTFRTWPRLAGEEHDHCWIVQRDWHLREVATECRTCEILCRYRHVSNPPLDHMLFRSYPNWRRRWDVGFTIQTFSACSCAVEIDPTHRQGTNNAQRRSGRGGGSCGPTMYREGKSASDDLMDWLFHSQRGTVDVLKCADCVTCASECKNDGKCAWESVSCLHQSWSTNTFFCNLHSEWDLLCTSNVDHSSFQTKDFVYIGAFLGIHHCYLPCKCGWHTLEKRLKETTVIFITWCVPMMKPHIWIMVLSQEDSDDRMEDKQRISQCCTNFVCRDKLDFLGCGSTDILFSEKRQRRTTLWKSSSRPWRKACASHFTKHAVGSFYNLKVH